MLQAIETLDLGELSGRGFQAKIPISIESSRYWVKTVENSSELHQALQMRHDVFVSEFGIQPQPHGYDTDRFDFHCDHMAIIERSTGRVVGNYRLISSLFSDEFYSQGEFQIDSLLARPGSKLELGRACILPEYRNGAVISLLWRGIARYIQLTGARYLFGCSSVKTTELLEVALLCRRFRKKGFFDDHLGARVQAGYRMSNLDWAISEVLSRESELDERLASAWTPTLLDSYLRAGAKLWSEPALDASFRCVDFFTVLDTDEMARSFDRKYKAC